MSHVGKLFSRQWKVILIAGALVGVLSLGVSLIAPLEYKADAELLILIRQQVNTDPLTVSRAQERIAEQLARAVETDAFFDQVMAGETITPGIIAKFDIDNERKKRKRWHKSIDARAEFGTSLLTVSAFDTDRDQAEALADLVATTLVQESLDYVGIIVSASVVNNPIASAWPVRPNILLNTLLGFLVGVIGMGWLVLSRTRGRIL